MLNKINFIYWVAFGLVVTLPVLILVITRLFKENVTYIGLAIITLISIMPGVGAVITFLAIVVTGIKYLVDLDIANRVIFKAKK